MGETFVPVHDGKISARPVRKDRPYVSGTSKGRALPVRGSLDAIELRVLPALRHQLLVRSDFDDFRAVEDDDEIGHAHGGEAV